MDGARAQHRQPRRGPGFGITAGARVTAGGLATALVTAPAWAQPQVAPLPEPPPLREAPSPATQPVEPPDAAPPPQAPEASPPRAGAEAPPAPGEAPSGVARSGGESAGGDPPRHRLSLGVLTARPAALDTGLATGAQAGWRLGEALTWGASLGWGSATEFTRTREVRHDDLRLRARVGLEASRGVGRIGAELAVGGTLVVEQVTRNQGERAGLSGDALHRTALALLPGAELELTLGLDLFDDFGAVLSGGPSLHQVEGEPRLGWLGLVALSWSPR